MTDYNIIKQDEKFYITGEIDVSNCEQFKEKLYKIVDNTEMDLQLEFSDLRYIDSAGLGILVGTYKRLKEAERKLTISGSSENIKKLFYITKLNTLIDIT